MDAQSEVRDFLTSRRARITPAEVGLVTLGVRHVVGLRREEVATLAGVSVEYYNRMERGRLTGVSDGVLDAVANALRLDDAERMHLFDLARAANIPPTARRRTPTKRIVPPTIEWLISAMAGAAAFVVNRRQDILSANHLGRAFLSPMFDSAAVPNMARFTYLDPKAREFFLDWNRAAQECVAALRMQAGRSPHDRDLSDLVGELTTGSEEFAAFWATHNVRLHQHMVKQFNHPVVGELELRYDRLAASGVSGLEIFAYVAEPGSRSAESLELLANWAVGSSKV